MAAMALLALGIICGVLFIRIEMKAPNAFVDFKLFKNSIFTGATISNLLLNGTAGILIVAMSLVQLGGDMTAQEAGLLTLGYGITIVAFIRVGEKLLRSEERRVGKEYHCKMETESCSKKLERPQT